MNFEGWAVLSAEDEDCGLPDTFGFNIEAECACAAREQARELCCVELRKHGIIAVPADTNEIEVWATLPSGQEIVYIVDVD